MSLLLLLLCFLQNLLITKFRLAERIGNKMQTKATSGDLVENKRLIDELMRDCPDAHVSVTQAYIARSMK